MNIGKKLSLRRIAWYSCKL